MFQSSYEDTINKINASLSTGDLPNLVQVYEGGTQRMIDTKRIIPMQDLIERDKLQSIVDDLEPVVRASYTIGGKLYSMPFNTSTAVWYIDRKAFKEAGLNPDKKLWTYDEMLDVARKLVKKDASGKVTRYGMAVSSDTWIIEQCFALHNIPYGEPNNGRTARMTKYIFNTDHGAKCLEFYKKMIDEGTAIYYGANSASGAAASDYTSGKAAMTTASIGGLRTYIATVERLGNPIDLDIVQMPRFADAQGVSAIGGASLWITNAGAKEQQEGAWDFIKFAARPDTQAFWASNTGYFPVVGKAYDQPEMKDALKKYPQFQTAVDQLRAHPTLPNNQFNVSGVFVSMRSDVVKAMDDYFGGKKSIKDALDAAAAAANEKLEDYNASIK